MLMTICICLYPRVLRLVPRCSEWTNLNEQNKVVIHLRLEFVAFAPICLGRRDLLLDFPNRVTGMKQVGQTNRRNLHNSRNLQIVHVQLLCSHRNEARRTDKSSQFHNFRKFLL